MLTAPTRHRLARAGACMAVAVAGLNTAAADELTPAQISGDTVPQAFSAMPGDAARGRALLVARENANCILCHAIPEVRFFGNLAPSLEGVGARLSTAQLRLRVADNAKVNASTIMPSYFRSSGLTGVAAQYQGRTILTAQEVEDVVAYLQSLK